MPSIEESKRKVKAGLERPHEIDHDAILASLQDEIDRHNEQEHATRTDSADGERSSRASLKFRFKSGSSPPRKRKHRSKDHDRRRHKHRKNCGDGTPESAAHPFPREPTQPTEEGQSDSNAAFRDSLFDALADDEGAAYWENVYNQPIHIYPRPSVKTERGELEEMSDEQYAAYVQTKMWEKKNPHIVLERERKEKLRREEEGERAQRREEFIRRKERAAWERAQNSGARKFAGLDTDGEQDDYEYVFDFDGKTAGASKRASDGTGDTKTEDRHTWVAYQSAWDRLKIELLNARDAGTLGSEGALDPPKMIPWPVLATKPVIKVNIENFLSRIPVDKEGSRLQLLKAERVKWHPDKIQQRFGGCVDEGTMKIVTGIFQVVDSLVEKERVKETG